jgi:hypothetical protein
LGQPRERERGTDIARTAGGRTTLFCAAAIAALLAGMPLGATAAQADEPPVEILDCGVEQGASTRAETTFENHAEHEVIGPFTPCGTTSTATAPQALVSGTCFTEPCSAQASASVSAGATATVGTNGMGVFSTSAQGSADASASGFGEASGFGNTGAGVVFKVNVNSTYQVSGVVSTGGLNSNASVSVFPGGAGETIFELTSGSNGSGGTLKPGVYHMQAVATMTASATPSASPSHAAASAQGELTVTPEPPPACPDEKAVPSVSVGLALAEGCFTERKDAEEHGTGVFETSEEAWVGGFDLKPNPGGVLVIEPSNQEDPLRAEGSGVSLLLRHLSVPAPLGELKPFVGSYTLGVNTVGSVERFVKLPLLSGQVTVKWDPGGAGATLEGGVSLEELSKGLGSLEAGGVGTSAGKLTLKLANNAPADVTGGELQLPEFTVELKGTNPKLKAGFGGGKFKAQEVGGAVEWSGEVSAFFPFEERQGSIIGRLFLRETSLSGAGFALSGIQVPIAKTGWSLTGVNGNLVLTPELGFDLGIEAVKPLRPAKKGAGPPLFKLTGNVKGLKLATDCKNGSNPFEFLGTTNAPELEARKIGTLKAQVLMCAYVPDARDFAFEAGLSGVLTVDLGPAKKVISAKGSASGWFHGFDFNLEGNYQLTLPVFGVLGAQGLLSSEGYAICGQYDFISAGVATHNWLEAPEDIVGCDFTPYRAAKPSSASASAAHGPGTVRLRRGERVVALAVRGAKGAPRVRLRGPHGERFKSPKAVKPLAGKAVIIVPEPRLSTTYVYLKRPSAGLWRIQALGGTPIRRIDIAHQLPEPKVSATIGAKGGEEVLSWKARPIPGQKIALIDRTDGVATMLQGFTARHAGRLRFAPESPSDAPRRIEADILQNGIPRARLTVARYRTTGSKERAPHLRIARASCGGRTCKAKLRLPAGTRRIRLELRRGKRKIATSTRRAKAGTRAVTLRLPHIASPGTYTLRVTAVLGGGQSTSASKVLHIRRRTASHQRRRRRFAPSSAPETVRPLLLSLLGFGFPRP